MKGGVKMAIAEKSRKNVILVTQDALVSSFIHGVVAPALGISFRDLALEDLGKSGLFVDPEAVIFMDIAAFERASSLALLYPACASVVLLAADLDAVKFRRFVLSGGHAMICTSMSSDRVIHAIDLAIEGQMFFPAHPLKSNLRDAMRMTNLTEPHPDLTERENDILEQLVLGKSNKLIARDLGIREPTVKMHIHNMALKLDVRSRTQIIARALQLGLVKVPSETMTVAAAE